MPGNNTSEAPQPAPKAPQPSPQNSAGKAPIVRAKDWVQSTEQRTGQRIVEAGTKAKTLTDRVLRTEVGPTEETNIFATPFYAAGHILDGTALNAARRGVEVIEPIISGLRASYRATLGAVLSPINTILHPIEYAKNPIRIITSGVKSAINAIKVPIRAGHEAIDRGITRTIEQINYKIGKIPILGDIIAKPTNFVAGICSKISGAVRNAMDWVTSPVDKIHEAVAPA